VLLSAAALGPASSPGADPGAGAVAAVPPPPPPAVSVRLARPDLQAGAVLDLFRGSRAASPAAALAAWKHAGRGRDALPKPLEAAIAALNPATAAELRRLDGATLVIGGGPGPLRWRAAFPADDGTLADLIEALALTDGGLDPPLDGRQVLRLGGPGSAVSTRREDRVDLASDRDGLNPAPADDADDARPPGAYARLDPAAAASLGLKPVLRAAASALRAAGGRSLDAALTLTGETLVLRAETRLEPAAAVDPPRADLEPAVEPAWLDAVPASGAAAVLAVALGPGAVDSAFAALDGFERGGGKYPAGVEPAPWRVRVNLLAAAAGVRPEVELWPDLRGVTVGLLAADGRPGPAGVVAALHLATPAAAGRVAGRVLPRLAALYLRADPGVLAGRPLAWAVRGPTVLLGWGVGALESALGAWDHPSRSARSAVSAGWGPTPPGRAGAFWPGRLAGPVAGPDLARAWADAPPVVWQGRTDRRAGAATDLIRWPDLRAFVAQTLDALPLEPPPDH